MPNTTIDDFHLDYMALERKARLGFVTGGVPRLLPEDRIFHQAVLATWVEPEVISQWMSDLGDRAATLLADWAAERGTDQIGAAA